MSAETKRPNPVKTLRLMGCKVKVYHNRLYKYPILGGMEIGYSPTFGYKCELLTNGGCTRVVVETPTGQTFEGVAECSMSENYCKKTGVAFCLDRLKAVK